MIRIDDNGTIRLDPLIEDHGLMVFYKLKLHALKQSYEFRILSLLISNVHISPLQVCNTLFISKSYLYRLIKTINLNLSPLNIRIEITDNTIGLSGDELIIRTLGVFMNTDAYQSLEWPYSLLTQEEICTVLPPTIQAQFQRMSKTKQTIMYHLLAIIGTRLRSAHRLESRGDSNLRELFELLVSNYDVTKHIDVARYREIPADKLGAERLYFNFLCRVYLADIFSETSKIRVGAQMRQSSNYFAQLAVSLCATLSEKLKLNLAPDVTDYFVYFFTIGFAYYHLLGTRITVLNRYIFDVSGLSRPAHSDMVATTSSIITRFMKEHHLDYMDSPEANFMSANFVSTILEITMTPPVHVYLQSFRDFTAHTLFRAMVGRVFNPQNVLVTTDINEADIIITDSFEQHRPGVDIFFFDDMQTHWPGILQAINECILRRMFQVADAP